MKRFICYQPTASIFFVFFSFISLPLFSQVRNVIPSDIRKTDLPEVMKNAFKKDGKQKKKDKLENLKQAHKKVYVSFVPVSSQRRGGKKSFVSSINSAFYMGKSDSTYLSNISLEPSTNFSNKYGIGYHFNLWTKDNKWNIPGDVNITNLDQFTWGLGGKTIASDKYQIGLKYVRLYGNLNRDWHGTRVFFYGLGFRYDRIYNQVARPQVADEVSSFEKYGIGINENLHATGMTFNVLYNTRRNSVNPKEGVYVSTVFRINPTMFGNELVWSALAVDLRRYIPLTSLHSKRRILAVWALYWRTMGDVPYLLLPATSTDFFGQAGRGWAFARFRGKEMFHLEAEYRFDISQSSLFGGVVFCNAQSFTEPDSHRFEKLLPVGGTGVRIKINKKSNTNFGLDFSYSLDGFGISALLGEAF
jgi:hypothetical protein